MWPGPAQQHNDASGHSTLQGQQCNDASGHSILQGQQCNDEANHGTSRHLSARVLTAAAPGAHPPACRRYTCRGGLPPASRASAPHSPARPACGASRPHGWQMHAGWGSGRALTCPHVQGARMHGCTPAGRRSGSRVQWRPAQPQPPRFPSTHPCTCKPTHPPAGMRSHLDVHVPRCDVDIEVIQIGVGSGWGNHACCGPSSGKAILGDNTPRHQIPMHACECHDRSGVCGAQSGNDTVSDNQASPQPVPPPPHPKQTPTRAGLNAPE